VRLPATISPPSMSLLYWVHKVVPTLPAARAYSRPSWLLPRALSPLIPAFLLVTVSGCMNSKVPAQSAARLTFHLPGWQVYLNIGNKLDAQHATSIAGAAGAWCVQHQQTLQPSQPAFWQPLEWHGMPGVSTLPPPPPPPSRAVHAGHLWRLRLHGRAAHADRRARHLPARASGWAVPPAHIPGGGQPSGSRPANALCRTKPAAVLLCRVVTDCSCIGASGCRRCAVLPGAAQQPRVVTKVRCVSRGLWPAAVQGC
jgi:hypothetical protein